MEIVPCQHSPIRCDCTKPHGSCRLLSDWSHRPATGPQTTEGRIVAVSLVIAAQHIANAESTSNFGCTERRRQLKRRMLCNDEEVSSLRQSLSHARRESSCDEGVRRVR